MRARTRSSPRGTRMSCASAATTRACAISSTASRVRIFAAGGRQMSTEAKKFRVCVFAIAALVIGVGGLIWIGASRIFEDTVPFVTYFSESVQGLDPGSSVKYRGVPAGRVKKISIAPDGNLIEVLMDVKPEFVWYLVNDQSLRTQLQLSGITGLRYVEIEK